MNNDQEAHYIADLLYFCQWFYFFLFLTGVALACEGHLELLFLSVVLLLANNEIRSKYK
jgi:hypothetical protein